MKIINIFRVLKITQVHSNHLQLEQQTITYVTGKIEGKVVLFTMPQRSTRGVDI
jgi:hypothetical protein